MSPHPEIPQLEIDEALRQLGSIKPPAGLEHRITQGLHHAPRRFSLSVIYSVSGGALAASVALSAVVLSPSLRHLLLPQHTPAQNLVSSPAPRIAPATGGFGPSNNVHVPTELVPVQPTPINQGRGRSRSGRGTLSTGSVAPLPRGVAPTQPMVLTGTANR